MTMGKSKALVAGATGVHHMTIATDSGMARTVQSVVWDSSSWRAALDPTGELTTLSTN